MAKKTYQDKFDLIVPLRPVLLFALLAPHDKAEGISTKTNLDRSKFQERRKEQRRNKKSDGCCNAPLTSTNNDYSKSKADCEETISPRVWRKNWTEVAKKQEWKNVVHLIIRDSPPLPSTMSIFGLLSPECFLFVRKPRSQSCFISWFIEALQTKQFTKWVNQIRQ